MDIQLKTGCFDDAALVRRVVFMDEQGYENEFDAIDEDPNCIHVTLYVDGELAGCSRVFPEELERVVDAEPPVLPACDMDEGVAAGETYIMGRVAVLPAMRRRGLASAIVEASAACACNAGAKLIKLHAQEYVLPLYAKAGYTQIAPVDYEDEGQARRWQIGTFLFCRQLGTLLGNWRIGALRHTVFRFRMYICALMGYKI